MNFLKHSLWTFFHSSECIFVTRRYLWIYKYWTRHLGKRTLDFRFLVYNHYSSVLQLWFTELMMGWIFVKFTTNYLLFVFLYSKGGGLDINFFLEWLRGDIKIPKIVIIPFLHSTFNLGTSCTNVVQSYNWPFGCRSFFISQRALCRFAVSQITRFRKNCRPFGVK